MVKRGSVCSHPSHPQLDRSPLVGIKLSGEPYPPLSGSHRPPHTKVLKSPFEKGRFRGIFLKQKELPPKRFGSPAARRRHNLRQINFC